jgi:phosphatidylserine/phosphatidylglycerophosphate/cardiolipin synthase-like enzyme
MKWCLTALLLFAIPLSSLDKEPICKYEVLFSPNDHLAEELVSMIDKERKSIKVAVYQFLHRGILKALIQAQERGVEVEVILDSHSIKSKSPFRKTAPFPLSVFVWSPPARVKELANGKKVKQKVSSMHNKFCVFGDNRVWIGSFDFTLPASNLDQESVIVLESREVAAKYLEEFSRLKKEASSPLKTYLTPEAL